MGKSEEQVYEIAKIVAHKPKHTKDQSKVKKYKVNWVGYDSDEDTWEPAENITAFGGTDSIAKYWEKFNKSNAVTPEPAKKRNRSSIPDNQGSLVRNLSELNMKTTDEFLK